MSTPESDPKLAVLIDAWLERYIERGRRLAESKVLQAYLLAKDRQERTAKAEV